MLQLACYFSKNIVELLVGSGIFKIIDVLLMENEGSSDEKKHGKALYSQTAINLLNALFPSSVACRQLQE